MKFIVPSTPLLQKLQAVNGAILSKPVIPALENFYFDLADGKLTITTSDLETFLQESLEVESKENIQICVPSKSTTDILRALGEQPLTFTIDPNNSIELSTSSGRYKLAGESADEFPNSPQINAINTFVVPANVLLRGINKTIFATGNDDLRLALTGVFFEIFENSINFVATDANRLVRYTKTDIQPGFETSFILPKKSLNLLKAGLPNDLTPVTIDVSESNIRFTCGSFVLISRILDEKFPDYKMVIPQDNNNVLFIPRAEFLNSVKRIAIFSNQHTHQIRVKIAGSELNIMSEDIEKASEAHEKLICDYEGEDLEIGFNSKYLVELLSNIEASEIAIRLSTPSRAGLVLPKENEDGEDVLMLIMPMMLNNY